VPVRADSNGNAAGASLEDAILQGFFELVERDAVALWWYNRTRQPEVRLDSFDDPWVAGLRATYGRLNREVWVLDVTSDLGIPVMAAVSRRTDKPAEDIMLGFGAHFDPKIAVRRALTELGQLLPAAGGQSDGTGYALDDLHLISWWTSATIENQRYLRPDPVAAPRTAASYGYTLGQSLDLARMCAIARGASLDILVLNQTRPDIKMPVVKVVVPGLRHFWPRFAPGRLYDVPARLGRLAEPTPYENLNPIPLYL
jgi:ribosomal protein S12 methylthiotransferase accessory factor